MYIKLFPKSRFFRLVYMTAAFFLMLAILGEAWAIWQGERAFSSGATADVFLFNGYRETGSVTGDNGQRKNVKLGFHDADGDTLTVAQDLADEDVATLKAGGTLRMQYLPEHPQASARLEGHGKPIWPHLIWAGVLAVYGLVLKPQAVAAPSRQRA